MSSLEVHLDRVPVYGIGKEFLKERDARMGVGGGIAMLVVAVPAAVLYENFFLSTDDPFPSYCLADMNAYATTCGGIEILRGSCASDQCLILLLCMH